MNLSYHHPTTEKCLVFTQTQIQSTKRQQLILKSENVASKIITGRLFQTVKEIIPTSLSTPHTNMALSSTTQCLYESLKWTDWRTRLKQTTSFSELTDDYTRSRDAQKTNKRTANSELDAHSPQHAVNSRQLHATQLSTDHEIHNDIYWCILWLINLSIDISAEVNSEYSLPSYSTDTWR